MNGKHEDNEARPVRTMHEDDPVLVNHYPTVLTRINVKRVAIIGAILTFIFLVYTGYALITVTNRMNQESINRHEDITRQISQLACAIVAPFKDSAAPIVKELRERYNCPPFRPSSLSKPTATKTATATATATKTMTATKTVTPNTPKPHAYPVNPAHTQPLRTHQATPTPRPSQTPHASPTPTAIVRPPQPTLPVPPKLAKQLDTLLCKYLHQCNKILGTLLD